MNTIRYKCHYIVIIITFYCFSEQVSGSVMQDGLTCDTANGWINGKHGLGCVWFPENRHEKTSYSDAKQLCSNKGGYLIEFHSKEQLDFIREKLREKQFWGNTWAGATNVDTEGEGCWVWGNSETKVEQLS